MIFLVRMPLTILCRTAYKNWVKYNVLILLIFIIFNRNCVLKYAFFLNLKVAGKNLGNQLLTNF